MIFPLVHVVDNMFWYMLPNEQELDDKFTLLSYSSFEVLFFSIMTTLSLGPTCKFLKLIRIIKIFIDLNIFIIPEK